MADQLAKLIDEATAGRTPAELALGWLRYETLRRTNPSQFVLLHERNLRGEWFDDLVDEALIAWKRQ